MAAEQKGYGALVGWTASQTRDRVALHLQSVSKAPPHTADDVETQIYLMDRNQAMQLANYLFELGNTTTPSKRGRGLMSRLFG